MAYLFIYRILYNRVTSYSNKMKKILSRHKLSSSTAFIKKALYKNVRTIFAKVKGQFLNGNLNLNAQAVEMKKIMGGWELIKKCESTCLAD